MYKSTAKSDAKGIRCSICIGCGRCPGVVRPHVVTHRGLKQTVNLQNSQGYRLVTADVGTTTVAMLLHRVDGTAADRYVEVNPQRVFGADVMSRILASEEHAPRMRKMILEVLERGLQRLREQLQEGETLKMVLAGNTTMIYLLLGIPVADLGKAPFKASYLSPTRTEIGGTDTYIFPALSAFVGGDIVAGIRACGMLRQTKPVLLIDLGTNGEMVLGNRDKIVACATAAGPAFEGCAEGRLWGADLVKCLALLKTSGQMDGTGLLCPPFFETGIRVGDVLITGTLIRSVQLAKAAIAAGIRILTEEFGCTYGDIDTVFLAGGFGYYLDAEAAAEIGMLPKELVPITRSVGNAALAGALEAGERLLQGEAFEKVLSLEADKGPEVSILNLAEQGDFEKKYISYLNFEKITVKGEKRG